MTSNGTPISPLPLYAPPAPVDRICYKIKCPVPPPPFPPDQNVTDQFGNRTLMKFKAAWVEIYATRLHTVSTARRALSGMNARRHAMEIHRKWWISTTIPGESV